MHSFRITALTAALAIVLVPGCETPAPKCDGGSCDGGVTPITKVGFIYVGPVDRFGWTASHEEGRLYLEQYTSDVSTMFRAAVAPADAPAVIDEFVDAGASIVFSTSFDFLDSTLQGPMRHPGLTTFNCSGFKTGSHAGNYQVRVEESEYLTGMVAGRMTRTNKIGVVAALRIYEQMMHINAFTRGVRAVNPNAEVNVRFVANWFNPPMELAAVRDLAGQGNDIIKGLTDTTIPVEAVADYSTDAGAPVYAIGHDNRNNCEAKPETCLVSSFYNWGPLYKKLVEEVRAGAYPAGGRIDYLGQADMDVGGISTFNAAVPQTVRDEVTARQTGIRNRTFSIFAGPFNKADGGVWLTAGQSLSDMDLICTKDFVEGVNVVDGPSCTVDADCTNGFAAMTCTGGLCRAADLSGCTP
jgi:basic membrane protein A